MGIRSRNIDAKGGAQCNLGLHFQWTWDGLDEVSGAEAAVVAAVVPNTTAGGTKSLTIAAQPDFPRTINCEVSTDGDADLTAKFDIYGITSYGERVHETVSGVTLAGGAVESNYAYRSVSAIVVTTDTSADVDAADRVRVGLGPSLGLPYRVAAITDIHGAYYRLEDQTSGIKPDWTKLTVVSSGLGSGEALVDVTYGTIQFNDAIAAGAQYHVEGVSTFDISDINMS